MASPTAQVRQVAELPIPPKSAARASAAFGQLYFLHLIGPPSLALASKISIPAP